MTGTSPVAHSALAWAGVTGQLAAMAAGTTTSAALVELTLARLAEHDPTLHVVCQLRAEAARREATAADRARAAGDDRRLLGLPLLVKESHAVTGLPRADGTSSPAQSPEADTPFVAALRHAGAVVVASTTMPELALWPHGPARNPWDRTRTAGGSSSGSAAAVAAGLVAVATASDGGGSIRIPAAACGLVGLKVGAGQLPGGGGWHGLSVDGVLTRSVADTALVLDAATGGAALTTALDGILPPLRVGWTDRAPLPPHAEGDAVAAVRDVLAHLRRAGHDVEGVDLPWHDAALGYVPRYARGAADNRAELADPSAVDARTAWVTGAAAAIPAEAVVAARREGERLGEAIRALGLDLIVLPALPGEAPDAATLDTAGSTRMTVLAGRMAAYTWPLNAAGLAAISVPVGVSPNGLPLGVQLVAPDNDLVRLVSVAALLEAATRWTERRPPDLAMV